MKTTDAVPLKAEDEDRHLANHFYEHVFRITLSNEVCCNKSGPASLIFLNELNVSLYQTELDQDCLDRAVFERLLLEDPAQHIVHRKQFDDDAIAIEKNVVFYLYQSYYRLKTCTDFKVGAYNTAKHVIIKQISTLLCYAKMLSSNISEDLMKLILHYHNQTGHCERLSQFLIDVTSTIAELKSGNLVEILGPSFSFLREKLATISLSHQNLHLYIEILDYFTGSDNLIKALLKHSMPKEIKNGKSYQNSLLGLPLAVSCLPKSKFDRYEFFQDPLRSFNHYHAQTEERLQVSLISVAKEMHRLFETILRKSKDSRELLLQWIGNCLDANSGRTEIWNSQLPEVYASLHGSDGFFTNLLAVLLLLCRPFIEPCSLKLLKINPLYCSSPLSTESKKNGVHLRSLVSETCLLPRDEPMETEDCTYNFITECFFATHYAFRIGLNVINEKMVKQNQDLIRSQRLYEEARSRGSETLYIGQQLKEKMEKGMTKFLSYRTALLVPETLRLMLKFHIATATWLAYISTKEEFNIFRTLKFPPLTETSCALSYVPEFILENIIDFSIFLKRFSAKSFELAGSSLEHFISLILMLMGSPERVKNPHLRAHLAEMLESLMPEKEPSTINSDLPREKLFTSHLFVNEMIPALLNVFVSIEMTGQSVQFEQKFQYRRPMYIVLDYLWNFDIHKKRMKEMAEHAERNMESPHPPIFFHFINLLINDAIFLLDKALTYMSQLRKFQQARDSGAWDSMSSEQQQQQEGNFHHMGLLAKFHNVMSNETINTLQWLTTEIKSIFCHPTIVERIATMLNYFLLNLVGGIMKNVKLDLIEYEFKPQELVRDICKIYQNLGALEDAYSELFCSAISRDGRSYNGDLFPQAQIVLKNIKQEILASQLGIIENKVAELAIKNGITIPSRMMVEQNIEQPSRFDQDVQNLSQPDVKVQTNKKNILKVGRSKKEVKQKVQINEEISILECLTSEILEPIPGLNYIEEYRSEEELPAHYVCKLCQSKNSSATIMDHLSGYKHQKKCFEIFNPERQGLKKNLRKREIADAIKSFFTNYEKSHGRGRVTVLQQIKESNNREEVIEKSRTKKRKIMNSPNKVKEPVTIKKFHSKNKKLKTPHLPADGHKIKGNSLKRARNFTALDITIPTPLSLKLRPIIIDGSNVARGYSSPSPTFDCYGVYICVRQFIRMGHSNVKAYLPSWRRTNLNGEIPTTNSHYLDMLHESRNLIYTCSKRIGTKKICCYDDIFLIKQAVSNKGVVVSNDAFRDLIGKDSLEFDEVIKKRVLMFVFSGENMMLPMDPLGRFGPSLESFLSL